MSTQTQDYGSFPVRAAAILTTGYVPGAVIGNTTDFSQGGVHLKNQLILYVDFTKGSLTSLNLILEFSPDNSNWYQETFATTPDSSTGISSPVPVVYNFTATFHDRLAFEIKDRYVRVSVQGVGTVTSSSCAINSVIGIS